MGFRRVACGAGAGGPHLHHLNDDGTLCMQGREGRLPLSHSLPSFLSMGIYSVPTVLGFEVTAVNQMAKSLPLGRLYFSGGKKINTHTSGGDECYGEDRK